MMESTKEYVSVSEYAKLVGKTTQNIYHMIDCGLLPVVKFKRGKMNGWLIEKPNT